MALPPTLRTWTNAARLTQEPLDPRQGHGQRPLHRANRLPAPPHPPQQVLLLDAKAHRPDTHPDLHQHIVVDLH